jgi:uncharacterized glyoxalase superfamily protein PhnB
MNFTTTAHANFRGQARDALTYYQSVFGGELALATYADIHSAETPETADHDRVRTCKRGRWLRPHGLRRTAD